MVSVPRSRLQSESDRSALRQLVENNRSELAFVIEGPPPAKRELEGLKGLTAEYRDGVPIEAGNIYFACAGEVLSLDMGMVRNYQQTKGGVELHSSVHKKLIDYAEEGLSIISAEGKPLFVSRATAKIFGCSVEDAYKLDLFDIVHPEDHTHVIGVLEKAMQHPGDTIDGGTVRVKRQNGEWRWCEASITNMLNDPDINGIIDTFRDVTEMVKRKNASEFDQKNTLALINSTEDAMWSIDKDYRVIQANRSFEKLVQRSTGKKISFSINLLDLICRTAEDRQMWEAQYLEAFAGKKVAFTKSFTIQKSGERRWCEVNLTPIFIGTEIQGVAASSHDITKIKQHSTNLEALNEKLTMVQRLAKLGHWALHLGTRQLEWSGELREIWGWKDKSGPLTFEMLRESIHPDDKQVFDARFSHAIESQSAFQLTHRICRPDAEVRWVKQLGIVELDEEGAPLRLIGACQDITLEKRTEKELEQRNAFIETAMDNLPIGIAVNEVGKGTATFVNKMFAQGYGWPKHTIKDREEFFANIYPDKAYREKMQKMIMNDIESGDPERMAWNEVTVTGQDGVERQVNARNIPLPEQGLMISTVIDVTQEVKNRSALKLSNDRYKYASKASFDAMWDFDVKNETLYWGDGLKDNFGHSFKKNISHLDDWARLLHPEDYERATRSFSEALANPKRKVWSCEYRMQRADGSYAHVYDRGYILRNSKRKAYRSIGALQDVTHAKEEEMKLRLRESVINSAKEGIVIAEIDDKNPFSDQIVYVNEAFTEITGQDTQSALHKSTEGLLIPSSDELAIKNVRKARKKQVGFELEMLHGQGAGGTKWISCSMSPVLDKHGKMTHWVTFIRDITERRTYVDILQNQNKRLREIAFTQSHLVRTPLSRLLGLVYLLNDVGPNDADFDRIIESVKKSANELDMIIKSIVVKTSVTEEQSTMKKRE